MSGADAKVRAAALLDEAAARGWHIDFWWRDDDAEDVTPALDRLLSLAARHSVPLALAVVPKGATERLASRLARAAGVSVLQHGFAHANHARAGEKKIELGGGQPLSETMRQLEAGLARLTGLCGDQFLPVLVPPWNRVAEPVREAACAIGLAGLSTFGPAPGEPHRVNTHLDIFQWKPARRALSRDEAFALLATEIERRLGGSDEPVGILTHHLVHDETAWATLDAMLGLLAPHPAARWPQIGALFDL